MSSKYNIGQDAQYLSANLHLVVGNLDDGEWSWNQHPLPHQVKMNLRESGLLERTEGGWQINPDFVEAALKMAEERGYEVEDVLAD